MKWFYRLFTWWHGQTLNTALYTLLYGKFVGEDEFGNRYYRSRKVDKALGVERRWVIFSGESDGSMQPPGWYGWLHHTVDAPPARAIHAPRMGKIVRAQFDRHAPGLEAAGLDLGGECTAAGNRRLRCLDAGGLILIRARTSLAARRRVGFLRLSHFGC